MPTLPSEASQLISSQAKTEDRSDEVGATDVAARIAIKGGNWTRKL